MHSRTELIGRIGQTEVKDGANGKKFANITIATDSSWLDDQGQWQKHTEWHSCVCFNQNIVSRISDKAYKGRLVQAIGQNQTTKYEKDGQDVYFTNIRLNELRLLDKVSGDKADTTDSA